MRTAPASQTCPLLRARRPAPGSARVRARTSEQVPGSVRFRPDGAQAGSARCGFWTTSEPVPEWGRLRMGGGTVCRRRGTGNISNTGISQGGRSWRQTGGQGLLPAGEHVVEHGFGSILPSAQRPAVRAVPMGGHHQIPVLAPVWARRRDLRRAVPSGTGSSCGAGAGFAGAGAAVAGMSPLRTVCSSLSTRAHSVGTSSHSSGRQSRIRHSSAAMRGLGCAAMAVSAS